MSEWRGLHNHVWHDPSLRYPATAECRKCADRLACTSTSLCRCCLAAEVERLTKVLDAHRGMGCTISSYDERAVLLARAEAAEAEVERLTADYNAAVERIHELLAEKVDREAAIQRVREVCDLEDAWWLDVGEHAGTNDRGELPFAEVYAILRALDGGPDHA